MEALDYEGKLGDSQGATQGKQDLMIGAEVMAMGQDDDDSENIVAREAHEDIPRDICTDMSMYLCEDEPYGDQSDMSEMLRQVFNECAPCDFEGKVLETIDNHLSTCECYSCGLFANKFNNLRKSWNILKIYIKNLNNFMLWCKTYQAV